MSFIDSLEKKIATAIERAKNRTKAANLKKQAAEEEVKLKELYEWMGRRYINAHTEDYESGFEDVIKTVREAEANIWGLIQQAKALAPELQCPSCGKSLPKNTVFCSACGTKIPVPGSEAKDPSLVGCPRCGQPNAKHIKFCTACGSPLPVDVQKTDAQGVE